MAKKHKLPVTGTKAQAAATGALNRGREELPHFRGQGQKPGGPHARTALAKRSYPTSEARGGSWEEPPQIQGEVAAWA